MGSITRSACSGVEHDAFLSREVKNLNISALPNTVRIDVGIRQLPINGCFILGIQGPPLSQ